jgi:putative acid phosphatase of HAD superfamily subfamily IIIB
MNTLRCCSLAIAVLTSGLFSGPAVAEVAVGCDSINSMAPADHLIIPQNLGVFKQQLLIYRCKRYDNDIAMVIQEALAWVKLRAGQVSNPAIVLDIDETSLSNWMRIYQDEYYPFTSPCDFTPKCSDTDWQWTEQAPAVEPVLNLYNLAQCIDITGPCTNVDVYFVTGRHEGGKYAPECWLKAGDLAKDPSHRCGSFQMKSPREWTLGNLQKAGFKNAADDHLYMRPVKAPGTTEPQVSSYKTDQRIKIESLGKTIIANIGDQFSDLVGLHAERTFKVPNPFYFIP